MLNKILISVILSTSLGCHTLPESRRNSSINLRKEGVPTGVISNLSEGKRLDNLNYNYLAKSKSEDVRFLVASNRFIPAELMAKFEYDSSLYVRSGLASNIRIKKEMMQRLSNQDSWQISSNLVKNSSAPSDLLLKIYRRSSDYGKSLLLLSYSKNPKIPLEIRKAIMTSTNEPAIDNLKKIDSGRR